MPATSASCGSFGSGVLSKDWRDRRADLMVRTGDQAEDRVSRQIAPYESHLSVSFAAAGSDDRAYSLAADIGMPHFGIEFHYWRSKWILSRYSNINGICAAFIRRPRRALERAFKMRQIFPIPQRTRGYVRKRIGVNIGNLFRNTTCTTGRHG